MNSQLFAVERSVDAGGAYRQIGTVHAAGNSAIPRLYYFTDKDPQEGINLYRLKQIDLDHQFEYSKIISVRVKSSSTYYSTSPNPAKGSTSITTNSQRSVFVTVQLLDELGRLLKQQTGNISQSSPVHFDLTGITPGLYLLRVVTPESKITNRLAIR